MDFLILTISGNAEEKENVIKNINMINEQIKNIGASPIKPSSSYKTSNNGSNQQPGKKGKSKAKKPTAFGYTRDNGFIKKSSFKPSGYVSEERSNEQVEQIKQNGESEKASFDRSYKEIRKK